MKPAWITVAVCLVFSTATPVHGNNNTAEANLKINNAQIKLTVDGIDRFIDVTLEALTGNRSAASVASCCQGMQQSNAAATSFFGDTGEQTSVVTGDDGAASANARNVLRGKIATASASGSGSSRAVLAWQGDVKWDVRAPLEVSPDALNSDADNPLARNITSLPSADAVSSAFLKVDYSILDSSTVLQSDGQGRFSIETQWDDITAFQGAVALDLDLGVGTNNAVFSGDLLPYASLFNKQSGLLQADNFTISDLVLIPINYSALLQGGNVVDDLFSGSLQANFSGRMVAQARGAIASVHEPATLALLILALLALPLFTHSNTERLSPPRTS
ncbi:MAG: hypothetical protein EA349_01680 [Halomonadaceae bacterium]|nr:MAG: hypothetical protein EA349_01680 [Halomonadaceae bacterium]